MEHVKIRMQLDMVVRTAVAGWLETATRNTAFFGVYFPAYRQLRAADVPAAGAWAGALGWLASYPVDVLKTLRQSAVDSSSSSSSAASSFSSSSAASSFSSSSSAASSMGGSSSAGMWATARRLGARGLFRGLTPTLARALPVHYTTLAVYERFR
jgi:solute carrier family 25 carnitine/acylcarnitine transporter 20/29